MRKLIAGKAVSPMMRLFGRYETCSVCGVLAPWEEFYLRVVKGKEVKAFCSKECKEESDGK